MAKSKTLRLILGDQLNSNHSWYKKIDSNITYVMMELRSETDYATHHIQKVVGFFAAMHSFAAELIEKKCHVIYIKLNDKQNKQSFSANLKQLINEHGYTHFEYQLPDEYRLNEELKTLCENLDISHAIFDSEHFFSSRDELAEFFVGKKTFLMESFYRYMRKKHQILMDGGQPLTGQWNYDNDNRKKIPSNHIITPAFVFKNDVSLIVKTITKANVKTIGSIDSNNFIWPIDRNQSLQLLDFFIKECLPFFGNFQDAMTVSSWSLYHARISFSLNTKMLSPLEVINAAIDEWTKRPNEIAYNQLEGFVRQIIGWREYMRGIYWAKMPSYASLNFFDHAATLPDWFWTGNTKMNCLKNAINQSLHHGYAHHIQRLMVTGNFALLAGVHPDEVDAWYLGIYMDAIEWVEITNTRGMSQFADGGIVGTKPYVSSATYIDKMSDYCKSCHYNKSTKIGEKACPFNSLYWNFYDKHEAKLSKNPRIGMTYNVWRKMNPDDKASLIKQADFYLKNINDL